ncbi:uncharacterized protein B0H18DRAFT_1112626 [Fomitopsis serialis]|uniref:uncharacterized protein n=1 Tax=Fomitopsis serialis TaxID=139415 RepID=UPI002008EB13|nr:uncharacterized protein B0H18DRAFT_1112626 [Neoantrodia serialis]KAH9938472.1 hypothetical protein B0H18DRAFT_1112626 [Neoantrodia serialis]
MDLPSWTVYDPALEHAIFDSDGEENAMDGIQEDTIDELTEDPMDEDDFGHTDQLSEHIMPQVTAIEHLSSPEPPAHPITAPSHASVTPSPANLPAQQPRTITHTFPRPRESRVLRSLHGLGAKIGEEWAKAINNYVELLTQSPIMANNRKAKKVFLKAKWAMGEMEEARNIVKPIILIDSGAAAAVGDFSDCLTHTGWNDDAIALWTKAVHLAEFWRHRFLPNQ